MNPDKDCVDVLSALLTPTVAIAAVFIGVLNYRLAVRRRRDELFDRRYEFYKTVERIWRSTGDGAGPDEKPWFEWDDIEPYAQEAEFLFGEEISEHLRSYAEKEFKGVPWVPDSEFSRPFMKYLKF